MTHRPTHILVPVDGSAGAEHALGVGAMLARVTGARLTTLYVVGATSAETMGMRHMDRDAIDDHLRHAAAPVLDRARATLASEEGLAETGEMVRFGDPADEILGAVQRIGADHVVMGSRGQTALQGLVMGSVSEKVARMAPCPVTIVR